MTWRYTTIDCIKRWFDYAVVGPAEIVKANVGNCVKAAVIASPLAVGSSVASLAVPGSLPASPASYGVPYPYPSATSGSYIVGSTVGGPGVSSALIIPQTKETPPEVTSVPTPVPEPSSLLAFLTAVMFAIGLQERIKR